MFTDNQNKMRLEGNFYLLKGGKSLNTQNIGNANVHFEADVDAVVFVDDSVISVERLGQRISVVIHETGVERRRSEAVARLLGLAAVRDCDVNPGTLNFDVG